MRLLSFTVVLNRFRDTCKLVFTHPSEGMDKVNQLRICFGFGGFAPQTELQWNSWKETKEVKLFGFSPSMTSESRRKCSSCGRGNCAPATGWNEGRISQVEELRSQRQCGDGLKWWWSQSRSLLGNCVWKSHPSVQGINKPNVMSAHNNPCCHNRNNKESGWNPCGWLRSCEQEKSWMSVFMCVYEHFSN